MTQPRRPKLILLEVDPQVADRFRRGAGRFYDVRIEHGVEEALAVLTNDPTVAAFVAGTNRNGEPPVSVLERVRAIKGAVLRIMLASPVDLPTVIGGLHSGAVERSVNLPVADGEILSAVTRPGLTSAPSSAAAGAPPARPAPRRAG